MLIVGVGTALNCWLWFDNDDGDNILLGDDIGGNDATGACPDIVKSVIINCKSTLLLLLLYL